MVRRHAVARLKWVSRLKWVKPINVNKSIGQPDDVSKTLLGEVQNEVSDLGLLFAKACVSDNLVLIRVSVYVCENCWIKVNY